MNMLVNMGDTSTVGSVKYLLLVKLKMGTSVEASILNKYIYALLYEVPFNKSLF